MSDSVPEIPGEVAGLGRRLAALTLDWLAAIGVSLLLFRDVAYGSLESSVAILLLFAAELILLTWLTGASFGQRILGLQVVRMDGGRLGLGRVALRTAPHLPGDPGSGDRLQRPRPARPGRRLRRRQGRIGRLRARRARTGPRT